MGGDVLQLGSKGRYDSCVGSNVSIIPLIVTHWPYLRTLSSLGY